MQEIEIIGAKKHNLKNISLKIPKRQLITITGVSGSSKSSLAYDTIFQEGQRKYLESLSVYARQFRKTRRPGH
jgi:excinuclease ABC subunit A